MPLKNSFRNSAQLVRSAVWPASLIFCSMVAVLGSPVAAQTSVFNNGSNTTVISPSGVTTINRVGNGYTVVSPQGVTTVNRVGNNYTIVGPKGVTSVFSNGLGNYTVIGNSNVVPIVPVLPDGADGFTAIGGDGSIGEILPAGDGGLLLIGD